MPNLKDLVCHVQWADTGSPFPEYGTVYGDGVVETYIAIPSYPQAFTIRLTSRKFIYDGLSMVVFIDGNYQCNRNRVNLQPAKKNLPDIRTNIDFLVRQKEKPMGDGTYMGREWRFDDCNLVSQLPEGVDEGHFDDLGTIEVLVLRCHSNRREESQCSTTSSGEHSGIMDDNDDTREELETGDANSQSKAENLSTQADQPQNEEQDTLGGLFGLFDGPADEWPFFAGNPGDAPSDEYPRWHWQPQGGHPAPYGPQERPQHLSDFRPASAHYGEPRRTRYTYHDSPPSSSYAHPANPPPPPLRPERRVHFDYGDGRGPQPNSYHARYDHQPHHAWEREDQHAFPQPKPSYHRPEYHRHRNPYADYAVPPESGHYIYNADRKVYRQYPEPNQVHGSSQPGNPLGSHPTHHSYYQPHTQGVTHEAPQAQGAPTFAASQANFPNSVPSMTSFPPLPPKIPIQPTNLPPSQPQPVQYPIPIWIPPPTMSVPPFPAAMPIYPPPNNAPLFQTQRIDPNNSQISQNDSISGPGGAEGRPNDGSSQQWGGNDANNVENNNPNTVQSNSAQDPPQNSNNSINDANRGNSGGDNTSGHDGGWKTGDANDGGSNGNSQGWNDNRDDNNNTTNCNDNTDNNDISQGLNDNADNSGNNTGQGWDGDNVNTGDNSWQDDPNQKSSGNQQSTNDGGWANDTQNYGGGGNNQANNGSNNQNHNPTPNNEPIPSGNRPNSRALYGPHGAYYTSKACAQNAPPAEAEEEPPYDVPQAIAQSMGVTKQVQPGKGYLYNKKRCVPHYLDSLDEPYARFVFKYRTKEQLKDEIGVEITAEPTPDEDVNALENLNKAELIQMVLRAKGALGGTIPSPPPKLTPPPPMKSFEQVPVEAPDVGFLRYSLPRTRNVPNTMGLGIRLSNASSNQSNAGNANQSNNWNGGTNNNWQQGNSQENSTRNNGGFQSWQETTQQQNNNNSGNNNQSWGNTSKKNKNNGNSNSNSNNSWNNSCASNKNGWDGQQEKQPGVASQPSRNFNVQAASRRSSAISPRGGHWSRSRPSGPSSSAQGQVQAHQGPAGPQGDMLDYVLNHPEEAAKMGMARPPPPPPPPPIAFTGAGTVGGGQTNMDMDMDMSTGGAGPRPPTPTGPPPPCSPLSAHDQGAFGPGDWGGGNAMQPASGW